ncbi:PREDICTED: histone acetyltransferase KAT6A-like, partial [Priapulus caudatus]|uniref:Histone acetyltransferase KAT6A-like n=1 Tax=Priapulus caudatus TaxID=37621 RepID=A0ABM1E782_PRICU
MVRETDGERGGIVMPPPQTQWILDAINKIKQQKQRPSVERICSAVRQTHDVAPDAVTRQLDIAVRDGAILKVLNKGLWTYKDPAMWTRNKGRVLKLGRGGGELVKVLVRSIKELGDAAGSSLKSVEKYVQRSYAIEGGDGADLALALRAAAKRAVAQGLATQDGRHYRAVATTMAASSGSDGSGDAANRSAFMNGLNITIPDGLDFPVVIAQEEK